MRMVNTLTGDIQCLHQDTTMYQVQEKYADQSSDEWRYELRVRYTPTNLQDLYENDKVTFYYYYDQVDRKGKSPVTIVKMFLLGS